jgi:hypothetical protein
MRRRYGIASTWAVLLPGFDDLIRRNRYRRH